MKRRKIFLVCALVVGILASVFATSIIADKDYGNNQVLINPFAKSKKNRKCSNNKS